MPVSWKYHTLSTQLDTKMSTAWYLRWCFHMWFYQILTSLEMFAFVGTTELTLLLLSSLPRSCCCRWPRTSRGSTSWSVWFRWIFVKELIWTKQFINCNYPFGYNPLENRILLTLNLRLIFPAPKLLLHGCEMPRLLQDHHGECHDTPLSQTYWDELIISCSFFYPIVYNFHFSPKSFLQVFSHAQTVVVCSGCSTVLCQSTGGRARLTEGAFENLS